MRTPDSPKNRCCQETLKGGPQRASPICTWKLGIRGLGSVETESRGTSSYRKTPFLPNSMPAKHFSAHLGMPLLRAPPQMVLPGGHLLQKSAKKPGVPQTKIETPPAIWGAWAWGSLALVIRTCDGPQKPQVRGMKFFSLALRPWLLDKAAASFPRIRRVWFRAREIMEAVSNKSQKLRDPN